MKLCQFIPFKFAFIGLTIFLIAYVRSFAKLFFSVLLAGVNGAQISLSAIRQYVANLAFGRGMLHA